MTKVLSAGMKCQTCADGSPKFYISEPTGFVVLVMKLNCLGWWLPSFTFIVTTGSRISFWMFLMFNALSVGDTVHTVCWGPRLNKKVRQKASGMPTFQTLFPSVKCEDSHCAPCATVHHALLAVWWNKCSPHTSWLGIWAGSESG